MIDDTSLPDFEGFDWSGGNAERNWEKHGVAPAEAEEVYFNRPMLAAADAAHAQTERRLFALGQTDDGRALFVAFTLRKGRVRVISCRDMSRKERRIYRP